MGFLPFSDPSSSLTRPLLRGTSVPFAFLLLTVFVSYPVHGLTLYVSPDGTGVDGLSWETAFPTIGEALLVSAMGDEVWIREGTYEETLQPVEGVFLLGGFEGIEGPSEFQERDWVARPTVLDGSAPGVNIVNALSLGSATLDGFTLTQGAHGVFCSDSILNLVNCTISNNQDTNIPGRGAGIVCINSVLNLENCQVVHNRVLNGKSASSREVFDNFYHYWETNEKTSFGIGAGVYAIASNVSLSLCNIGENEGSLGAGVYCQESSLSVADCTFCENVGYNGGSETYISYYSPRVYGEQTTMTLFAEGGGLFAGLFSEVEIIRSLFIKNRSGMGGGIGADESLLELKECQFVENHTSSGHYESWNTIHPFSPQERVLYSQGGGIAGLGGSIISVSSIKSQGGGLGLENSQISLTNSSVFQCEGQFGGGLYATGSKLDLQSATIGENTATFSGGALYLENCPQASFSNCLMAGNRSSLDRLDVEHNFIAAAGTADISTSKASFLNCTFAENQSSKDLGGLNAQDSNLQVTNCILWNQGTELLGNDLHVSYSNIEGGWTGPGDIGADPRFLDIGAGDFRLAADSPCIDSGTQVDLSTDLLGNGRPYDTPLTGRDGTGDEFDMGCYEYPVGNPPATPTPTPIPGDTNGDGAIGGMDLFTFARCWKEIPASGTNPCDLIPDHSIDTQDVLQLLILWRDKQ